MSIIDLLEEDYIISKGGKLERSFAGKEPIIKIECSEQFLKLISKGIFDTQTFSLNTDKEENFKDYHFTAIKIPMLAEFRFKILDNFIGYRLKEENESNTEV